MSLSQVAFLVVVKRAGFRCEDTKNALVPPRSREGARDMSRDNQLGPSDPNGQRETCTQGLGHGPEQCATRPRFPY